VALQLDCIAVVCASQEKREILLQPCLSRVCVPHFCRFQDRCYRALPPAFVLNMWEKGIRLVEDQWSCAHRTAAYNDYRVRRIDVSHWFGGIAPESFVGIVGLGVVTSYVVTVIRCENDTGTRSVNKALGKLGLKGEIDLGRTARRATHPATSWGPRGARQTKTLMRYCKWRRRRVALN